jgi:hypothetical protein
LGDRKVILVKQLRIFTRRKKASTYAAEVHQLRSSSKMMGVMNITRANYGKSVEAVNQFL